MVNARSGEAIAEGTVKDEVSKPAQQEIFESTVQNVPPTKPEQKPIEGSKP